MTDPVKVSGMIDIHELPTVQLQALWALDSLSDASKNRFSASEITTFLIETCGKHTSRQAITTALDKDKTLANKNMSKGGYRLMEAGRKKILSASSTNVHVINSGEPFLVKNTVLQDIFSKLTGDIRICDPYIDLYLLDILFKNFEKKTRIMILTHTITSKPAGTFERQLADFRKDGFQIEIGTYSKSDLHDRYIMDDHAFWLSGNSISHLGNKESFLIRLDEDIRQIMLATFNTRWKISSKS